MIPRMTIPITELRKFYDMFKVFKLETQIQVAHDFSRTKTNQQKFVDVVNRSVKQFATYDNQVEHFYPPDPKRKSLFPTSLKGAFMNGEDAITTIRDVNWASMARPKLTYLDREIAPRRTTRSEFDAGESARNSGAGGVDLVAWDIEQDIPFIGEIKTITDSNAFYALVQVLTYYSELSTPSQIERCNTHNLFKRELDADQKFALGIIFCDFNEREPLHRADLLFAKKIATHVVSQIEQIQSISFLNMEKPFTAFEEL